MEVGRSSTSARNFLIDPMSFFFIPVAPWLVVVILVKYFNLILTLNTSSDSVAQENLTLPMSRRVDGLLMVS